MLGSQPLGKEFLTAAPHPVGKMHLHLWVWRGPSSVLWRVQDKSTCCTKYTLSVCHLVWSEVARLLTKHPLCGFSTSVEEFQDAHRSRWSQELGAGREFHPPLCLFRLCFWDVGAFGKLGTSWKDGFFVWFCLTFILQEFKIMRIVKCTPVCPSYRCRPWRWSAGFHWGREFLSMAPDYLHQNQPQTSPLRTSGQTGTLPCASAPHSADYQSPRTFLYASQ